MAITSYEIYYNTTGAPVDETGTLVDDIPALGASSLNSLLHDYSSDGLVTPGSMIFYGIRSKDAVSGLTSKWVQSAMQLPLWSRSASWPTVEVNLGEQKIGGLVQVPDPIFGSFTAAFTVLVTGSNEYYVDWGDSSQIQTVTSGLEATHQYGTSGQSVVKITPGTGGIFTGILSSGTSSGAIAELVIGPSIKFFGGDPYTNTSLMGLQHLVFLTNFVADAASTKIFSNLQSLEKIEGSLNLSACTDLSYLFDQDLSLISVPSITTGASTSYAGAFSNCDKLTDIPLINTTDGQNFRDMFANSAHLTTIPAIDCSNSTVLTGMFDGLPELTENNAYGFKYSVNLSNTAMDATALNTFFSNLGVADNSIGQQTVTVTGCPGTDTCDRTIAGNLGWTVTS